MKLTRAQCDKIDKAEQAKALAWVDRNVHVQLTEPQKVGIASFCPWNIGPGKCFPSGFYRDLNAGNFKGACVRKLSAGSGMPGVIVASGRIIATVRLSAETRNQS
jgi:GH24 family phage-related lysozyme (muramidase)